MRIKDAVNLIRPLWHSNPALEGFELLDREEKAFGAPLPADYKYFLQFFSNGGEGDLPGGSLTLLPIEELNAARLGYGLNKYLPHLWMIGQDGDNAFAFDTKRSRNSAAYPVINVPLGALDVESCEDVGKDFADFLLKLANG